MSTHQEILDKKRAKERKKETNDSPNEKKEIVINGAVLKCQYASAPGKLVVTSNEIYTQNQLCATEGDRNGSINLQFQCPCGHPKWAGPKPPPMCNAVIKLQPWQNLGTTVYQEQKTLIKGSCIFCDPIPNVPVVQPIPVVASLANTDQTQSEILKEQPGYYYQKDGTFLGKIENNEDVYITDKGTFDKIKNKEKVEASKVIAFTGKYKLNNKEVLNRANWTYGEGGGYIVERYAMTIENLKKSGRSGYGPTPFKSEEDMYKKTMLHGSPQKCLYPGYFDGTYGAQVVKDGKIIQYENGAHRFAMARKSTNYSDLNSDTKKKASIKAVFDSLLGNLTNEGYNNWRGSGDKLYTTTERDNYIKDFKQPKDQDLYTGDRTKKVYARVKTTIEHYWEPVDSKFRRHSFYKIKQEKVK